MSGHWPWKTLRRKLLVDAPIEPPPALADLEQLKAVGAEREARRGRGPGRPVDIEKRDRVFALFLGEHLNATEIAERLGITRQAVNHYLWAHLTVEQRADEAAHRTRQKVLAREANNRRGINRVCRVCGAPFSVNGPTSKRITCGGDCPAAWTALRYACESDRRDKHRKYVAARALEIGRLGTCSSTEHYERVLNDEPVNSQGRWFLEGSVPHQWAVVARDRGWPIYDELPDEIKARLNGEHRVPSEKCEQCGQMFVTRPSGANRFCSRACFIAFGGMKDASAARWGAAS